MKIKIDGIIFRGGGKEKRLRVSGFPVGKSARKSCRNWSRKLLKFFPQF